MSKVIALCRWNDDEVFEPVRQVRKRLASIMVVGQEYVVEAVEHHPRDMVMHRGYFAELKELWLTLPEEIADAFPSPDHLRKHLLIKTGYHTLTSFVADTEAKATEIAAFTESIDEFAVVTIDGCVVNVYRARSQSVPEMSHPEFRESRHKVLDAAYDMCGLDRAAVYAERKRKKEPKS